MAGYRSVAVIINTHMTCYREMIRGITAFAHTAPLWQMSYFTLVDNYSRFIREHRPDGLLVNTPEDSDEIMQAIHDVPHCVGVCSWLHAVLSADGFGEIIPDEERVGAVAAEHFIEKGYSRFAFVGNSSNWSLLRAAGFESRVRAAGGTCSVLQQRWENALTGGGWDNVDRAGELVAWIKGLGRPSALLACNDHLARGISQICRKEGIRVPDDVAILGVDNDDLDCELSDPPLSSVAIPWRQIGYDCAHLLHRMMTGDHIGSKVIAAPPLGVIERQSTDAVAVSDPDIADAIRFIRGHAHEPIGVADVLRAVPITRRSLERRFRSILQRTPLEEIRRAHIERAKLLLATTDLPVNEVANQSGFGRSTWFVEAFRDLVGEPPGRYRKRSQRA